MKTFSGDSRKLFNVFFGIPNQKFANETRQDGHRLPDPKSFCESLKKLKWVKKILNEDASFIWKILIEKQLESVGGNLIWQCSFNDKDHLL